MPRRQEVGMASLETWQSAKDLKVMEQCVPDSNDEPDY
jgi:hypothetical protein